MKTKGRPQSSNIVDIRQEKKLRPRSDRTGNSKWAAAHGTEPLGRGWATKKSRKNINNTSKASKRTGGGF